MVLVDTPVWSTALRRNRSSLNPTQERCRTQLVSLIENDRAQLLGVVRQELLSGVRELAQYERLKQALWPFPDVALATADYEEAAAMHNTSRSQGIAGTSADFLICAVAARRNWPVLTLDEDFARYSSCLPIRLY